MDILPGVLLSTYITKISSGLFFGQYVSICPEDIANVLVIDVPRSLGSSFAEANCTVFPVVSDAVRPQENSTQGPGGVRILHVLSGLAVEFVSWLGRSKSQQTLSCKFVLNSLWLEQRGRG